MMNDDQLVGQTNFGHRSERRTQFVKWCTLHGYMVANTFSAETDQMWTYQNRKNRHQLDYIILSRSLAARFISCDVLSDVDIGSDHRPVQVKFTIAITPILYKLFSRVFCARIQTTLMPQQSPDQAAYRAGYSTEDHLLTVTLITELCSEWRSELWLGLIDFEKAFDTGARCIVGGPKERRSATWRSEELAAKYWCDLQRKRKQHMVQKLRTMQSHRWPARTLKWTPMVSHKHNKK